MHRLRTVTYLDVSAVAGHHAMPAALLLALKEIRIIINFQVSLTVCIMKGAMMLVTPILIQKYVTDVIVQLMENQLALRWPASQTVSVFVSRQQKRDIEDNYFF